MNCGLMFDQANSFYICAGLCEKELKNDRNATIYIQHLRLLI